MRKSVSYGKSKRMFAKTANRTRMLPGKVVRNKRGGKVF